MAAFLFFVNMWLNRHMIIFLNYIFYGTEEITLYILEKWKPLLLERWLYDCDLKMNCRSQLFVLFWIFGGGFCNVVKLSPSCVDSVCEFDWVVDYKFTMMWYNKTSEAGPQYQPVELGDDGLFRRRSTTPNCTGTINRVTLTGSS